MAIKFSTQVIMRALDTDGPMSFNTGVHASKMHTGTSGFDYLEGNMTATSSATEIPFGNVGSAHTYLMIHNIEDDDSNYAINVYKADGTTLVGYVPGGGCALFCFTSGVSSTIKVKRTNNDARFVYCVFSA